MSIHPSLRASDKDKKHRSVLKRTERLKIMLEKGSWKEGEEIYGLPKIKILKIKIKKEKAPEKVEAASGSETALPGATEIPKESVKSPGPASKTQDKK